MQWRAGTQEEGADVTVAITNKMKEKGVGI